MANRGGPQLGYSVVAGTTPCAGGWLVASAKLQGATFAPEDPWVRTAFIDILDERPSFSVVALNVPIGYLDTARPGGRTCDRVARSLLGARRGAAVHSAPIRAVLESDGEGGPDALDAISHRLLPRYREVAGEMAPYLQRNIYEVHPELSFYQINGDQPLRWSKRTAAGRDERRALLIKRIPGVVRILNADLKGVPTSHLLDAAAMLWTARRVSGRSAARIPEDPEWDSQGLRMEMVF
jgi:predicted RNase H-like nuclease